MSSVYTVILLHERDGRYSASVPALPGCHTWGDTVSDALRMADDAIARYLAMLRSLGRAAPADVDVAKVEMGDAVDALVCRGGVPVRVLPDEP